MLCSCTTFVMQPSAIAARGGTSALVSSAAAASVAKISVSVSAMRIHLATACGAAGSDGAAAASVCSS